MLLLDLPFHSIKTPLSFKPLPRAFEGSSSSYPWKRVGEGVERKGRCNSDCSIKRSLMIGAYNICDLRNGSLRTGEVLQQDLG